MNPLFVMSIAFGVAALSTTIVEECKGRDLVPRWVITFLTLACANLFIASLTI